jgi:hypothetical protein
VNPDFDGLGIHVVQPDDDVMSLTDTYEVEDIGVEVTWLRCRRCGLTWRVFDGPSRASWRCPAEPHDAGHIPKLRSHRRVSVPSSP